MPAPDPLVAKVESLQNLLVSTATGGSGDRYGDYEQLRRDLLNNPLTGTRLPRFVRTCRDLSQFWQFIKYECRTYAERREYIWGEFRPLLDLLEARATAPVAPSDEEVLSRLSPEAVQTVGSAPSNAAFLTRRAPSQPPELCSRRCASTSSTILPCATMTPVICRSCIASPPSR